MPSQATVFAIFAASWRGQLHDPDLAAVADRLLELSAGRFDLVSGCGHVRGADSLAEKIVAEAILEHLQLCGWRLEHKAKPTVTAAR
jgi:hypothetical protein